MFHYETAIRNPSSSLIRKNINNICLMVHNGTFSDIGNQGCGDTVFIT